MRYYIGGRNCRVLAIDGDGRRRVLTPPTEAAVIVARDVLADATGDLTVADLLAGAYARQAVTSLQQQPVWLLDEATVLRWAQAANAARGSVWWAEWRPAGLVARAIDVLTAADAPAVEARLVDELAHASRDDPDALLDAERICAALRPGPGDAVSDAAQDLLVAAWLRHRR